MSLNSVVISSWGAVYSTLDEKDLVKAAFNDHDLSHYPEPEWHKLHESIPKSEQYLMGPHAIKACLAVERSFMRAKLWTKRNSLRAKGQSNRHPRAAIVAGTSLGMLGSMIKHQEKNLEKSDPYTLARLRGNSIAAPLAIRFGLGAGDFSLSAASATGGQAIWLAAQLIQLKVADLVVVVSADMGKNCSFTQRAMDAMGVVASSLNSRPLSSERNGMRPVDAAAAIILESESHAVQRGFKPMMRWTGGAVKNDCHHLITPHPQALALEEAILESLQYQSKIDWLALHATGTKAWDSIETSLMKKIFGRDLPHISAFKRSFGHSLGSACLLSIAMIAEGLCNQTLPKLPDNIDPNFDLEFTTPKNFKIQHAMNWSVGMGGSVAVNLFETYDAD
jgi:3-oxoacyl-(acyl-carrier-protein) synthase